MKSKRLIFLVLVVILTLTACQVIPGETTLPTENSGTTVSTEPSAEMTVPTTEPPPTTEPTEPPVIKETIATIGAVGDILMHKPVIDTGYNKTDKSYDFGAIFTYYSGYTSRLDYAVANLETTLCGNDNGYNYKGYPRFNCPDAIVTALRDAGFDMLLTANNHTYDTGHTGFLRTQQIIAEAGLDYTGTVTSTEEDNFLIREINGVSVGMVCYTYNTDVDEEGKVFLNGIPMTVADSLLINSFSYQDLEGFYTELAAGLEEMERAGAEATILFIHWGDEYRLTANKTQKNMAQAICDLGVDVIIGGHAHVVEPVELLTSSVDESHKTVCLYSMGNAVSNQRKGLINACKTAHTEDGVLFSVTFAKYSDGSVVLENVEALPTWVNMHNNTGVKVYEILPLDTGIEDWQTAFSLTDDQLSRAWESYQRTMDIIGEGLAQAQAWCAENQAAVEAELGVRP